MELPAALRHTIDEALEGVPLADLAAASAELTRRYRAEIRDGRFHVSHQMAAQAYLATRLPATYAAVRGAFAAIADGHTDFAPTTMLDVGAGPGTVALGGGGLLAGPCQRDAGRRLAHRCGPTANALPPRSGSTLRGARRTSPRRSTSAERYDLVTLSFVLDELSDHQRDRLVAELWRHTAGTLVIVEPGRPAGWERILRARDQLLGMAAHMVAPCPHTHACPLVAPDWCHFAQRLARSRVHRLAKGGDVPWEDEKYSYVAVSRTPVALPDARIIAPPHAGSGKISLKLCQSDGAATQRLVTRRDGDAYKRARRSGWGDALSRANPKPSS